MAWDPRDGERERGLDGRDADVDVRVDGDTGEYRLDRSEGRNPVVDAIFALARIEAEDPLEMNPLYEELAPDVLPSVVAAAERNYPENGDVTFSAYGHTVRITDDEVRID